MDPSEQLPKPWDQQPNEPEAAYARFQIYLNLGRGRSLQQAYDAQRSAKDRKKPRTKSISGTWGADCSKYHWVERALAKDIDDLTGKGYDTVIDFVNSLAILANKTVKALANEKVQPRSLKSILELVNVLGSYIPAETVAAVRADADQRRISAIGAARSGNPTGVASASGTESQT